MCRWNVCGGIRTAQSSLPHGIPHNTWQDNHGSGKIIPVLSWGRRNRALRWWHAYWRRFLCPPIPDSNLAALFVSWRFFSDFNGKYNLLNGAQNRLFLSWSRPFPDKHFEQWKPLSKIGKSLTGWPGKEGSCFLCYEIPYWNEFRYRSKRYIRHVHNVWAGLNYSWRFSDIV